MASNGIIAHRFANRDYNFERGLKGSSVHIDGNNYYSYSTVFGQWVDEKVCLVYHGATSITSNKHKLWDSDFPKDVTLFPYDDGGGRHYGYGYYHGCNLIGRGGEFDYDARVRLIDYWVSEIYAALNAMVDGKSKDLDKNAERTIAEYWAYVGELCSMYKDTSVPKWLKKKRIDTDGTWKRKKIIVKALYTGERSISVITDFAFGQGTYKKYYDYCARYRKAEDKKAQMSWLCSRLGIANPYERWARETVLSHDMKADDIRKLSAKERNELHFRALAYKEWKSKEDERSAKYEKNRLNAYKWIVGCEPTYSTSWGGYKHYDDKVVTCKNMFTGETYDFSGDRIFGFYWCTKEMQFKYDDFCKSENKEEWLRNFYAKCKEAQDNRRAITLLKEYGIAKEKKNKYDDDIYIGVTHRLAEVATDEDRRIVNEFIARQDKHYADEEARKRAAEIERQRQAEERRREEEYQRQVKQEQIDACLTRGAEGCRNIWRLHLDTLDRARIYYMENNVDVDHAFYYGGNVLLRFNLDKTYVESSKNVRVPVAVARLWFKKVKQWHEDEKSFKPIEWNTKGNGTYIVSSYKNDILTAGCHDIAYAEMERMYNQIIAETA